MLVSFSHKAFYEKYFHEKVGKFEVKKNLKLDITYDGVI